jgi:hypothetical protein
VRLVVTPAAQGAQVLMVMLVIQATQVLALLMAGRVLRVTRALMVMLVQQVQQAPEQIRVQQALRVTQVWQVMRVQQVRRAPVLLRAVQALRVMPVLQVMLAQRVTQVLALHRATLGRLMPVGQEIPDRRPQPTAQTPQKFGRFSRFRSRLVAEARRAKSPLLGDGLR